MEVASISFSAFSAFIATSLDQVWGVKPKCQELGKWEEAM